jgi:cytidine deaminase
MTDADRELYARAEAAAGRAYAPYSNFRVGAAARARNGRVFEGVNVENAAYPLGICAERSALARAVGEGLGPGDLDAIAITVSPCGGCRQWLLEFKLDRVVYVNNKGDLVAASPEELLPDSFTL